MIKTLLAALALSTLAACGSSDTCSAFSAFQSSAKCESVQACCSSTQCRYVVTPAREFPCDGTTCTAAAMELVAYCM